MTALSSTPLSFAALLPTDTDKLWTVSPKNILILIVSFTSPCCIVGVYGKNWKDIDLE